MRRILKYGLALGAIVGILSTATRSFAGNPVDAANFSDVAYGAGGYGQVTGLSWGARGGNNYLFLCNRAGNIYVIKNGAAQAGAVATVTPCNTSTNGEQGLQSILTDVDFGGGNPYVYIFVTETSGSPGNSRFHRYTFADNGTTVTLTGKTQVGPTMPTHGQNHNGGGITQDSNGLIYVAIGNCNNGINEGGNGQSNELTSLGSKVIRFDRAGNPQGAANFMAMTGNTRYIYARGFRNPFGLRIRPGSGNQLWMSEVGDGWEQIFHVTENSNQGWPTENNTSTTNGLLRPKYAYQTNSAGVGNCLTRHVFYNGGSYPAAYNGSLFFVEHAQSRIYNLRMSTTNPDDVNSGTLTQFVTGAGNPTDIAVGPDGALYYGALNGQVRRVSYNGSTPPSITQQPASQPVNDGQTATFSVGATGTGISYQWQVQPAGQTAWSNVGTNSSTYTTPATTLAMSGNHYRVTVSNTAGSVTSDGAAMLTVNPIAPGIGTQPANQTVTAGTNATFSVTVTSGSAPISYQWQSQPSGGGGFTNIGGATNATYTVTGTTTGMSGMQFRVVIDNPAAGTVTSSAATLTVNPATVAPTITGQPSNATVTEPATATFTVTAGGTNLTYLWEWRVNAAGTFAPVGGNTATLSVTNTTVAMSGREYRVTVSNRAGSVTSNIVTLTVTGPAAATPVILPSGGTYSGPVTVRITSATAGAVIHYTTNNTTPTAASPTYAAPFTVSANATVQAIAIPPTTANSNSAIGSAVFTITGNVPYGLPYRDPATGINITSSAAGLPATLSATGLFLAPVGNLNGSPGMVPFTVNNPLWSDGAVKRRWIVLPGTQKITFSATGEWTFPAGTILVKHFELAGKKLETRVFYVNQAGGSYGATYKWNAAGTEADLMAGAAPLDEVVGAQTWTYPSRADCMNCHNDAARIVLGPKTRQLNGTFAYPGGSTDNQIRTWNYLGMFTTNLTETAIPGYQKLVPVNDINATLENCVKSYLDSNCSNCHRPGAASGRAQWNGLYDTALASMGIIDATPLADTLGLANARTIAPGVPGSSVLLQRMLSTTSPIRMPIIASHVVDTEATTTITAWINTMTPTTPPGGNPPGGNPPGGNPPGGNPPPAGGGTPAVATNNSSGSKWTGHDMCGASVSGDVSWMFWIPGLGLAALLMLPRRRRSPGFRSPA